MISAIVAVDKNWGIGYNNKLLAHIPEDMEHFKNLTENHMVICGRKTWESLPNKPLSNRIAIVLTNSGFKVESGAVFLDLQHALTHINEIRKDNEQEWFIIGGEAIYKLLLPYCDRVYVTFIEKAYENVDTYFPNLNKIKEWEISYCTALRDYNGIGYAFATYDRKS